MSKYKVAAHEFGIPLQFPGWETIYNTRKEALVVAIKLNNELEEGSPIFCYPMEIEDE